MRSPAMLLGLGLALVTITGTPEPTPVFAQDKETTPAPRVEPREIWPAGLERIVGRYVFAQVASPGGLWVSGPDGKRQVSINELSAPARDRLTKAEIIISDLQLPSKVEASQRLSPSRRGTLRFYQEEASGKLVLRNLPGIGGMNNDAGSYEGPVLFQIDHSSHSNPSVTGVLQLRRQQESTWGVATLDYADLTAVPAGAQAEADAERPGAISNARILRSGVEIFAYVGWIEKGADGAEQTYSGAVRLQRLAPAEAAQ